MDVLGFYLEDMVNGLKKWDQFTNFYLDLLAHTANSIINVNFILSWSPGFQNSHYKKNRKMFQMYDTNWLPCIKKSMRAPGPFQNTAMAGKSSGHFVGAKPHSTNRI